MSELKYNHKIELREAVVLFTGFLIAIAFHEAGHHTSEALKKDGLTRTNLILPTIFFLTALRFFIGNQLYLIKHFAQQHGSSWYYDVFMVSLQSALMIFLGNVVTLEEGTRPKIGFAKTLVALCVIDVIWVVSKQALAQTDRCKHWKPDPLTYWWVSLNATLIVVILLIYQFIGDVYSFWGLFYFGIANVFAFGIDVYMTDLLPILPQRKQMAQQSDPFIQMAIVEATQGRSEGGIPIGSVLARDGQVLGRGHNKRVQDNDPVVHAEIDCLRNAGRIGNYHDTVLYSTLMPCHLCAGAVVQFGIKKVVVGESKTFRGAREFMESHGVEVLDLNLAECKRMMRDFIAAHPQLWNEDIGK